MGIRSEGYTAEQLLWLEMLPHGAALTSSRVFETKSNKGMRIIRVERGITLTAKSKGLPRNPQQLRRSLSLSMGRLSTEGTRLQCEERDLKP